MGVVLMYLKCALLCVGVNEFIETKLRLRAKSLASAIDALIDGQELREEDYRHELAATTGVQSTLTARGTGAVFAVINGASGSRF